MSIAFTFPGQGSQSVGMGKDLADAFPEARAIFDEVDDALGEKLSQVIWEGPEDVLTLTANAQPALMAVSLAAIRALRGARLLAEGQGRLCRRPFARRIFGARRGRHVLGRRHGAAAAHPRQRHAAGRAGRRGRHGGDHRARAGRRRGGLRRGRERGSVCQIANDNGGGQLVISGAKAAVEHAARLCTEKGAKRAIMLPVSAPFHSALMQPAADAMRAALATVAQIGAGRAGRRQRRGRAAERPGRRSRRGWSSR